MTNEAKKIELTNSTGNVIRFSVADAQAITKETLLVLDANRRVVPHTTGGKVVGIASSDKVANKGELSVGAWTDGIFEFTASGAITRNQLVVAAASLPNGVSAIEADGASGALVTNLQNVIGYAMTEASGDKVVVRVKV